MADISSHMVSQGTNVVMMSFDEDVQCFELLIMTVRGLMW